MSNEIRKQWVNNMLKIADPVITALSEGKLKETMPVKCKEGASEKEIFAPLEAFGRTLAGIAPWLENKAQDSEEEALRVKYCELTRKAIKMAVTPTSSDLLNFTQGYQPLVDSAFFAQGILRAPNELYKKLDDETKKHLTDRMKETRFVRPCYNNWLLFAAMIETFLHFAGDPDFDAMRIDYALRQHKQWYLGGGMYGDGPSFHADYYNSFVIQPMLIDILNEVKGENPEWDIMEEDVKNSAMQYASILERMIAPDGSYIVIGRSSCYRFGAFHALSHAVLTGNLESTLKPSQVRCALSAVISRVMSYDKMFDDNGWLNIGVCGHQPDMGEVYINTGSLYLCMFVFIPLGLPETDPFWADKDMPWTQKRIWG